MMVLVPQPGGGLKIVSSRRSTTVTEERRLSGWSGWQTKTIDSLSS